MPDTLHKQPDEKIIERRSEALFDRAKQVLPSGYTRHLCVRDPHPRYAADGDGCWITDVDGNRVIDWVNNFSALIHGHNNGPIVDAVSNQARRVMNVTMPSEHEIELAEIIVSRVPGVETVRFMNSGTEANIIAVKAARALTGKTKVAKLEGGYHGQYDFLEASFAPTPDLWGEASAPNAVPVHAGTPQSLLDELVVLPPNNVESARALLRRHADELAAVILDPYRIRLGMVEIEHDFLEMLREETAKLGIILIFDEVWSLRMGYHGYQGKIGITPDFTTMGKIIGGGLPIGALGGTRAFMSAFEIESGQPKIQHSGTFTANPLTMAAGVAGMKQLTPEAFDSLADHGERLREGIAKVVNDAGRDWIVDGDGSVCIVLPTSQRFRTTRQCMQALPSIGPTMVAMEQLLLAEGIMCLRGSFVGSTPIGVPEIELTVSAVQRSIAQLP